MKKYIFLILLILVLNCKESNKDTIALAMTCNTNSAFSERLAFNTIPFTNEEPYKIGFGIQTNESGEHFMEIKMLLANGAHYVSPNSKIAYKGRFTLKFNKNNHVIPFGNLIESPETVEEFDPHPFVNGKVNWVRENTNYKQKLIITNKEDFVAIGTIQFTIEPRCTLERIPFVISQKDGKLKIEIDNC